MDKKILAQILSKEQRKAGMRLVADDTHTYLHRPDGTVSICLNELVTIEQLQHEAHQAYNWYKAARAGLTFERTEVKHA